MTTEEEEFDPQTEFYECCRYGDEETGISILESYPDIDPCKPDEFGTTPLHAAAANGLVKLMEILVKRPGINLNVETPGGNTPLHYAAINRNSKIIAILVNAGADVKLRNKEGHSPLFDAMNKFDETQPDDAKTVDLLIGKDEDIPADIQVPADEKDLIDEPDGAEGPEGAK